MSVRRKALVYIMFCYARYFLYYPEDIYQSNTCLTYYSDESLVIMFNYVADFPRHPEALYLLTKTVQTYHSGEGKIEKDLPLEGELLLL